MVRASGAIGGFSSSTLIRNGFGPFNRKVAAFGDSRTNQASGADGWRNMGYIHWLRLLTGQRFDIKFDTSFGTYANQPADGSGIINAVHDNFGVSGNTTVQMLDRCDKMLSATDAGTFIVFGGVNDRLNGITLEQSKANITAIIDRMTAAGRIVLLVAEMPTGTATVNGMRLTGAALRDHLAFRHWLLRQARPGVYAVDAWPSLTDMSGTDSGIADARSDVTYDGRHPSMRGAFLIARALQPVIERIFPPVGLLTGGAADIYAGGNAQGALNANPNIAGSGGSLGTNCTGVLAAGWQANGGSGSAGASAAYGKISNSFGNPVQHVEVSGTPTGAASTCNFNLMRTASLHASLQPGDIIEGVADIAVAAGASGFISMALRIDVTVDGTGYNINDGAQRLAGNYIPDAAFAGVMRTPRYQIPAGTALSAVTLSLQAFMDPNVAASLALDVSAMALRKA